MFSTWHEGVCRGVIVALPHPSMFSSNRVMLSGTKVVIFLVFPKNDGGCEIKNVRLFPNKSHTLNLKNLIL